ncbi:Pentatricopeptide repeat-containing protein [Platanthera zijinensis]|uniref:Pentatricopeptide repeat-containing protein n=1 Tax=Platanthera zijinensis TaxID=2320716 RepID=A0AAP0B073_9ASPA
MTLHCKHLGQANYCLAHLDVRVQIIWKCSVSSLTKFTNAKENDNFWLKQLDHKDWLAPNEVLKVFGNLGDPELVIHAFRKTSARVDYKPSEALYSLIIDRLAHARKFDAIGDLLDRAKCENCRLSDDFFCKIIKIYGNVAKHLELAINTLYRMPEFHCWPTVKTFNCVLNMLVCAKQFEIVHEVFLSASKLGVSLDTCCFNILIKGLCELDNLEAGFFVLHEISKHRLSPNRTTYSILMHAFCKHGRVKEALEVYEMMDRGGCHPDVITFNILISGLCKAGKVDEGMGYLKTMKLKGCYPNSGTYQALLYGLLREKQFVDAKNFMEIMYSERKYPSFLSYKLTIEGLCSEEFMNDIDFVLKKMVGQGFVPPMGTWKKIVDCMVSKTEGCWLHGLQN